MVSFEQGIARVALELSRFSATDVTITSNRSNPLATLLGFLQGADVGAAVYFRLPSGTRLRCFACDRWDRVPDNLCAIAKHLESIRGQLRWGVATIEQSFEGFAAELPAAAAQKPWWVVLGFAEPPKSRAEIVVKYHDLCHLHHPDKRPADGGELFKEIAAAYKTGLEATP